MAGKKIDKAVASMEANLEQKTGRSIKDWVALVRKSKLGRHGEIVAMLKSKHAVTHGYANLIAHHSLAAGSGPQSDVGLIDSQYAGPKAALRPIYDAVIEGVSAFGDDLEIAPKKTYVSLRRKKQFALVQPSTKTRVDLGINLKGIKPKGRLEASGSFNAMVTHRVRLGSGSECDTEVIGWLKQAYDAAG